MASVTLLQERVGSLEAKLEFSFMLPSEFSKLYKEGLEQGFLFAVCDEALPPFVGVALELLFPDDTSLSLEGEVVQVMEMGEGVGMTIQVRQHSTVQPQLAEAFARMEALPDDTFVSDNDIPEDIEEDDDNHRVGDVSILHQLKEMSVSERSRYALRAARQARALLTQDSNPQVLKLLLKNPRLGLDEVQSMMRNTRITGEIVQMILKDRRFQGSEDLRMLIVRHPRTPTPIAIQVLRQIRLENLRIIAKSNALREAIRRQARTLLGTKS
ncbi:MAG: hypothetical protein H6728_16215 [Myxococcales bacterium]|nr:hypothetical protein [Myxococcales bacterium]MCB9644619.1 hypothetical protein [Myxococcales bacterium]